MSENLPALTKNAVPIAQVATGIGFALAALWFPPAALGAPVVSTLIEHYTKKPERILLERIKAGGIDALSEAQMLQFVPMAYRFYEAAKEGEYEHNLRLLGEYIVNELKQPDPSAANFKNIARKVEALSETELKVIALCDIAMSEMDRAPNDAAYQVGQAFVAATDLAARDGGAHGLNRYQIANALNDLSARGLLIPDGATRLGKAEEYYHRSAAFVELIQRAKAVIHPHQEAPPPEIIPEEEA